MLELFHPFVYMGKLKSWALCSVSEYEHDVYKRELAFGSPLTFPWPLLSLQQCHRFQLCNVLCVHRGAVLRGSQHETGCVPPRVPESLHGDELQNAFTACCEVVVK